MTFGPFRRGIRGYAGALVLMLGLVLGLVSGPLLMSPALSVTHSGTTAASAQAGRSGPDSRIGRTTCTLLGRAWVPAAPAGCSRSRCLAPGDAIRAAVNAEVCARGGVLGPRYGTFVDSRRCGELHRTWVAVVNVCISQPRRSLDVSMPGPGCRAPYTAYVTHTEREGDYDECLRPGRVVVLQKIAARTGEPFRAVASERSRTLCSYRYRMVFENGRCQQAPDGMAKELTGGTLVIGDSVAWRSADELAALRASWVLDALPGRAVGELGERVQLYLAANDPPDTVVVALGTNPSVGWSGSDYLDTVVSLLPATTRLVFVTPYRSLRESSATTFAVLSRYAEGMRDAVEKRPRSCLADWADTALLSPGLLVDGTHQTTPAERIWATLVINAVDACAARNP